MLYDVSDFNGAEAFFDEGNAAARWQELDTELQALPLCLQASGQAGRIGRPIFDPKETNARLTAGTAQHDWTSVAVPLELTMFGVDWDGGKNGILAEWQFSNYPFLWNNVIRSEAVFRGHTPLPTGVTEALVIVTKSGVLPASNSTLYYEQAREQLNAVTAFGAFTIPIRLVGLLPPEGDTVEAMWTVYDARYSRAGVHSQSQRFRQDNRRLSRKYEFQATSYTLLD